MTEVLLTVGTRKGLFIGHRRGDTWEFDDSPSFNAQAVYSVAIDTRREIPRLLVGGDSAHWGPSVFHSDDLGRTWTEPAQPAVKFPKDTGASLERVWQLHPATAEADVVYAGTEPAALYRSEDRGESFELVRPLWEHPTRSRWVPGGGGEGLHTIVTDQRDPRAMTVAVSTAGVFRTVGRRRELGPVQLRCLRGVPAGSEPGVRPVRAQGREGLGQPRPAVPAEPLGRVPERRRGRALDGHRGRPALDVRFRGGGPSAPRGHGVRLPDQRRRRPRPRRPPLPRLPYRRRGQELGAPVARACPEGDHYGTVLRDALCTDDADPAGVYFGNRNGEVYASADDGDSWQQLASHLPDVLCVRAAVID